MTDCLDIARYFIAKAYEDGREAEMTNMKVQKLLYYTQSLHLALFNEPLFDQEIQAWRYGPVCPPAYRYYSEFEARQLPVPNRNDLEQISKEQLELLEEVWMFFGEYHAWSLSGMTHAEFPWRKARKGLPPEASSEEPILLKDMKLLGLQKLDEIERDHPAYEPVLATFLEDALNAPASANFVKEGGVRDWLASLLD